jgi:pimeloyl-ACP methyl ester carboxylesterase
LTTDRFGNPNSAYEFDGVDDHIRVSDNDSLEVTNVKTITAWIKKYGTAGVGNNYAVMTKYKADTPDESGWLLGVGTVNDITFARGLYKGTTREVQQEVEFNNWYFLTLTLNESQTDSQVKLYINGNEVDSFIGSSIPEINLEGNPHDVLIGACHQVNGTISESSHFYGVVDDISIYNRALSEAEIQELYNQAGFDVDDDGDGYTENEGDCNDDDDTIYTGAKETCSDGIDQDCDGEIDEGCGTRAIFIDGEETWNDTMNSSYQYTVPDGPDRILVVAFSQSYSWWSGAMGGYSSFDNASFYLNGTSMNGGAITTHGWNIMFGTGIFYVVNPPVGEVTISWNISTNSQSSTGGFIAMTLFNCDTENPIAGSSSNNNIITTASNAMLIDVAEIAIAPPPDENNINPGPYQIKVGGTPFSGSIGWSEKDGYLVSSSRIVGEPDSYNMTWNIDEYASCVVAFKPAGEPSDPDPIDLEKGIVAYYPFDGNANDESGNGNNGTIYGANLIEDRFGKQDSALYFDGVDDYIVIPDLLSHDIQSLSISAWVLPETHNSGVPGHVIYKGTEKGEAVLKVSNNGDLASFAVKLGFNDWYQVNSAIPTQNSYVHLVGTYKKGEAIEIWVNGEKLRAAIPDGYLYTGSFHKSSIGAYNRGYSNFFKGSVDNVRIYNRALTEPEIQELYNQGNSQEKIVIQPRPEDGIDVWVTSKFHGGGQDNYYLITGGWGDYYYSLIKFNIENLPYYVNSAKILLYHYQEDPIHTSSNYLDRVTSTWDENTKWDHSPTYLEISTIPAPLVSSWYEIDITDLYNGWKNGSYPNHGIQLRPTSISEIYNNFYSSDYMDDPSLRPKLVLEIDYPDKDHDYVPDDMDNCPDVPNPNQRDLDENGIGNLCDDDIDGDGINNGEDPDDDNDGYSDEIEEDAGTDSHDPNSSPNRPPSEPVLVYPPNDEDGDNPVSPINLTLSWESSIDPDADLSHYNITVKKINNDNSKELIFTGTADDNETEFPLGSILNGVTSYEWAVEAIDLKNNSTVSEWWNFTTGTNPIPYNVSISAGKQRAYLSWDCDIDTTDSEEILFRIKIARGTDDFNYVEDDDGNPIEFSSLEAVVPTPPDLLGAFSFKVESNFKGEIFPASEDETVTAIIHMGGPNPEYVNIVRHSPILLIPGTGGEATAWDKSKAREKILGPDMRQHLEDFGLIYGGELELEYFDELISNWVDSPTKPGDFYICNYNEVEDDGGNRIFHPGGKIDSNYIPTKLFIDKIRDLENSFFDQSRKITLVGQSLGGLRARAYVQRRPSLRHKEDEYVINKVERLITMGTPNSGVIADHELYDLEGVWKIILGDVDENATICDIWAACSPCTYIPEGGYINDNDRFRKIRKKCDDQQKIVSFMTFLRSGLNWKWDYDALKSDVISESAFLKDLNNDFINYVSLPDGIKYIALIYHHPGKKPFGHRIVGLPNLVKINGEFMNYFLFRNEYLGDGFISLMSQSLSRIFGDSVTDIQISGENHESELTDYISLFRALNVPILTVTAKCPVEIGVESPAGFIQSKKYAEILGARYKETDVDGDGEIDKIIEIPFPEQGNYTITVTPEDSADPNETYSLEIEQNGVVTVLKENELISELDGTPEEVSVNAHPIANAGPDQTLEGCADATVPVTLDGSGSTDAGSTEGTNDDIVSFQWYKDGILMAEGEEVDIELAVGEHEITLMVTDTEGTTGEDRIFINVLEDTTLPEISIEIPQHEEAFQDKVTLASTASDNCGFDVLFYVREENGANGTPIEGYEGIAGVYNSSTGKWECEIDTTQLPDGYYVCFAKAVDTNDNETMSIVEPFSIRNWAIV